jgi:2-dehydro-3-deoxyphosphogalactonate aldolase
MAAATLAPWRRAGAAGFGVGSSIYKPGDGPAQVREKARVLMEALAAAG